MARLITKQPSPFANKNSELNSFSYKINFFKDDDVFYNNFKTSLLSEGLSKNTVHKLGKKITSINYHVDNKNKNILIVGDIQSGKTNSFLGVMSKAFDHKVNLAVVLAGVDRGIRDQNTIRIKNLFDNPYVDSNVLILESNDYKKIEKHQKLEHALKNNIKVIIVCIKNWSTINSWVETLKPYTQHVDSSIIIDDESDQFSLNDVKYASLGDRSATNKSINCLMNILHNKNTFILVTATPGAHIISSYEDTLKPDYIFMLERGVGYTPLSYFLTQDGSDRDNVTNTIPDDAIEMFKNENELGKSFDDAILIHLIHSILFFRFSKNKIDIKDKFAKMLIMPDVKTKKHDAIEKLLIYTIDKIIKNIREKDSYTIKFITNLLNDFNEYLSKTDNSFQNNIPINFLLEEAINKIKSKNIFIQTVNSKTKLEKSKKIFTFYIGCNKLKRGITISSLITTYCFSRTTGVSNSDSVSQAARWLGYRNSYIYFLTIFLSNDLLEDYNNIEFMNSQLFEVLSDYEEEGLSVKNLPRQMILKRGNNLTRVARESVSKQKVSFNYIESIEILSKNYSFFICNDWKNSGPEKNNSDKNKSLIENYILPNYNPLKDSLNSLSISKRLRDYPFVVYESIETFKREIGFKEFNDFPKKLNIKKELFEKIIKNNYDKKVIFSFIKNNYSNEKYQNKFYNRSWFKNKIKKIPVGPSDKYVGDENWFKNLKSDDYIIFQVYALNLIEDQNNIGTIYKLALLQKVNKNSVSLNDNVYIIEGVDS